MELGGSTTTTAEINIVNPGGPRVYIRTAPLEQYTLKKQYVRSRVERFL